MLFYAPGIEDQSYVFFLQVFVCAAMFNMGKLNLVA